MAKLLWWRMRRSDPFRLPEQFGDQLQMLGHLDPDRLRLVQRMTIEFLTEAIEDAKQAATSVAR
jgi:hypothetical protein